jgi:hypothetical protein
MAVRLRTSSPEQALALWIPAALGSVAFVRLRRSLSLKQEPAALRPLAESTAH